MSNKIIQVFTDGSRVTVLTENGQLFQGNRSGKRSNSLAGSGFSGVNWEPLQLPLDCEQGELPKDHTELLGKVAEVVMMAGPGGVLGSKSTKQIWDLVEDFKVIPEDG